MIFLWVTEPFKNLLIRFSVRNQRRRFFVCSYQIRYDQMYDSCKILPSGFTPRARINCTFSDKFSVCFVVILQLKEKCALFSHIESINSSRNVDFHCSVCVIHTAKRVMTNRSSKFDLSLLYDVQSIFSSTYIIHESVIGRCMFTIERCFSTERTEKSVQCSELGGVHFREVFTNRGFTVLEKLCNRVKS